MDKASVKRNGKPIDGIEYSIRLFFISDAKDIRVSTSIDRLPVAISIQNAEDLPFEALINLFQTGLGTQLVKMASDMRLMTRAEVTEFLEDEKGDEGGA